MPLTTPITYTARKITICECEILRTGGREGKGRALSKGMVLFCWVWPCIGGRGLFIMDVIRGLCYSNRHQTCPWPLPLMATPTHDHSS